MSLFESLGPQQRARMRAACRQSLYALVAGPLSWTKKPNVLTEDVFYDSCYWAQHDVLLKSKRAWGGDPRATTKSTRWTIGLPIWLSIQTPSEKFDTPDEYERATKFLKDNPWFKGVNQRILLTSASKENAAIFLRLISSYYESDQLFRFLFPELLPDASVEWTKEEITLPGRVVKYGEPYIDIAGITTRRTSRHYDLIIGDDFVHEQNWQSIPEIQNGIDWILLAEKLLENSNPADPLGGAIFLVGNYWTQYDVRAYVETNLRESYDIWHRSCWVCSNCGRNRCIRGSDCFHTDEPLWPERHTRSGLLAERQRIGVKIFSAQMENNPVDPDTVAFSRDDLRWCAFNDAQGEIHVYEGKTRVVVERIPYSSCRWFMVTDPASSTDPHSCRSAIGVFGEDEKGRLFFRTLIAARFSPEDYIQALLDTWDAQTAAGIHMRSFGVESVGGQRFIVPAVNYAASIRKIEHRLARPIDSKSDHIVLLKPDNKLVKEDRIRNLLGWRAKSNTFYVNVNLNYLDLFYTEWDYFPNGRSNDIVDMCAYAQFMCSGASGSTEGVALNRKIHARKRYRQLVTANQRY